MRKSVNLVLAGALAASAFASTAAAQKKAACGDGEAPVVTAKEAYTDDYSGSITTPNPVGRAVASVATTAFFVDSPSAKDVTVNIAWTDGMSDYDLEIEDEAGEEVVFSNEADLSFEQVVLPKVKGCTAFTAKTWQWIGDPTTPVTITIEVG